MEKVIIENRTERAITVVLRRVAIIIASGRVSGGGDKAQYCYATIWFDGMVITASLNQKSDRFVITYDERFDDRRETEK